MTLKHNATANHETKPCLKSLHAPAPNQGRRAQKSCPIFLAFPDEAHHNVIRTPP